MIACVNVKDRALKAYRINFEICIKNYKLLKIMHEDV